jgi:DNA repair protein RadD
VIELYPDQHKFVSDIRAALRNHRRVLAYGPTAFGKTTCFSYMVSRARERGHIIGLGVHREELLEQVSDTLRAFDVPHSMISADHTYLPNQRVYVVSVPTFARRIGKVALPKFSLFIQDEAHHLVGGNQWGKVTDYSPDAIVIGFSGSPIRLDGRGMGEKFDVMVQGPSVAELIAMGRLSAYKPYLPLLVDSSALHLRAGEYKTDENEAMMDKPVIYGDAIAHYQRIADWKRCVVFTVSVATAHHAAEKFNEAGYKAFAIDGTTDKLTRRNAIRDFGSGKLSHLTSCSIVDEGFDCPGIEVGLDLAPTMSLQRAIQRWGRTLRKLKGVDTKYLIDCVGNMGQMKNGEFVAKHGFPDDERIWSLDGVECGKEKSKGVLTCPFCQSTAMHGRRCLDCKKEIPADARNGRTVDQVDGTLTEVDQATVRRAEMAQAQGRARGIEQLMALGHSEARAKHIIAAREEKDALRDKVFSLMRKAGERPSMSAIRELKPKGLRAEIERLTGEMA